MAGVVWRGVVIVVTCDDGRKEEIGILQFVGCTIPVGGQEGCGRRCVAWCGGCRAV